VVAALLAAGADASARDARGATPLHAAALHGCAESAAALLAAGAAPDAATQAGSRPLALAARRGHAPVVRLLLKVRLR
jgi:ankyrin repeat protein